NWPCAATPASARSTPTTTTWKPSSATWCNHERLPTTPRLQAVPPDGPRRPVRPVAAATGARAEAGRHGLPLHAAGGPDRRGPEHRRGRVAPAGPRAGHAAVPPARRANPPGGTPACKRGDSG